VCRGRPNEAERDARYAIIEQSLDVAAGELCFARRTRPSASYERPERTVFTRMPLGGLLDRGVTRENWITAPAVDAA